jgi:hypothetical protein
MPKRKPKTKAGKKAAMHETMHEFKHGQLHSGSKTGPQVKSRSQAIAIGLKQSGQSRDTPNKREKRLEGKPL